MRALTLTQPWCGLMSTGVKLIENRPLKIAPVDRALWKDVAWHASKVVDDAVCKKLVNEHLLAPGPSWHQTGAILSVLDVVGMVTSEKELLAFYETKFSSPAKALSFWHRQRPFFTGPICYVVSNVRMLPNPVPCRGSQGFWTVPEATEKLVREQLEIAAHMERYP